MIDDIFIGDRQTFGGFWCPCFLSASGLDRHAYVLGQSGTGKSTLLQALMKGLIDRGNGLGLIDPHGDLAEWAIRAIPESRMDDAVYLDFSDGEFAPALNLVTDAIPPDARPRMASALVSALRHLWPESWGPRLEHVLYHAIRVLLDCQNCSLVSLPRLLTDARYRAWAVKQSADPFVRAFWRQEFDAWDARFRSDAIAPVLNKLGQLAAFPPVRQSLGNVRLKVDLRAVLDGKKLLIVNLAKGRMGEDPARLVGALLSSAICAHAMERGTASVRQAFTLFLDEAHSFASDAMATVLSETRKFGLRLVLAHQFLDQLSPLLRSAILGNAGNVFAFRLASGDAETMEGIFGDSIGRNALADLPPYSAYFRSADGIGQPVRLSIHRIADNESHRARDIVSRSRTRFCSRKAEIEDRLRRWLRDGESADR